MRRANSFVKTLWEERLRAGEEEGNRGWDCWMAPLNNGHELEQIQRDSKGQGNLAFRRSWDHEVRHDLVTEQQSLSVCLSLCMYIIVLLLSHAWFFCTSVCGSPPGSSAYGISQARILEWVAIFFSGDLPNPGIEHESSVWKVDSLPLSHMRKTKHYIYMEFLTKLSTFFLFTYL